MLSFFILFFILFLGFWIFPCRFFFFLSLFHFDFSWNGSLLSPSFSSWMFLYLICLVFSFILWSEGSWSIQYMIYVCSIVCYFFFYSSSYFVLYVCSELVLLPLLVMLLGWGAQVQKLQASCFLLFYSSFCTLPGLWCYFFSGFSGEGPLVGEVWPFWVSFLLCLGFFMKVPVYFLHYWLPLVHVESPTSSSIFLASVLLKIGLYGLAFFLPIFAWSSSYFYLFWGLIGSTLAGFCCISASDNKVIAAYSSIMHMGFVFLQVFLFSQSSLLSSMFLMLGHGAVSALWFYLLGVWSLVCGTRLTYAASSGLASGYFFFFCWSIMLMVNAGAPISYSFYGDVYGILSVLAVVPYLLVLIFFYYFVGLYFSVMLIVLSTDAHRGFDFSWYSYPVFVFIFFSCNMVYCL